MIKKRNTNRLALSVETLRHLNANDLRGIAGGWTKYTINSCSTDSFNDYTCCDWRGYPSDASADCSDGCP